MAQTQSAERDYAREDYEAARRSVAHRRAARDEMVEASAAAESAYLSLMRQKADGVEISEQKWRNYDAILEREREAANAFAASEEAYQRATEATL